MEAGNEEKEGSAGSRHAGNYSKQPLAEEETAKKCCKLEAGNATRNIRILSTLVAKPFRSRADSPQIHTSETCQDAPVPQSWFPTRT